MDAKIHSISPRAAVMVCYSVSLASSFSPPRRSLLSLCLLFFFRSGRDTAEHIEAVAGRAVNASKQTFALLIDLLQDNSTEEYIRNLTGR